MVKPNKSHILRYPVVIWEPSINPFRDHISITYLIPFSEYNKVCSNGLRRSVRDIIFWNHDRDKIVKTVPLRREIPPTIKGGILLHVVCHYLLRLHSNLIFHLSHFIFTSGAAALRPSWLLSYLTLTSENETKGVE